MATGGSSLCKILRFVLLRGSRIIFLCVDVLSLIYIMCNDLVSCLVSSRTYFSFFRRFVVSQQLVKFQIPHELWTH